MRELPDDRLDQVLRVIGSFAPTKVGLRSLLRRTRTDIAFETAYSTRRASRDVETLTRSLSAPLRHRRYHPSSTACKHGRHRHGRARRGRGAQGEHDHRRPGRFGRLGQEKGTLRWGWPGPLCQVGPDGPATFRRWDDARETGVPPDTREDRSTLRDLDRAGVNVRRPRWRVRTPWGNPIIGWQIGRILDLSQGEGKATDPL